MLISSKNTLLWFAAVLEVGGIATELNFFRFWKQPGVTFPQCVLSLKSGSPSFFSFLFSSHTTVVGVHYFNQTFYLNSGPFFLNNATEHLIGQSSGPPANVFPYLWFSTSKIDLLTNLRSTACLINPFTANKQTRPRVWLKTVNQLLFNSHAVDFIFD